MWDASARRSDLAGLGCGIFTCRVIKKVLFFGLIHFNSLYGAFDIYTANDSYRFTHETRNCRHRKTIPTGTLGDAIRAARKQAGLSRRELAQATGISLGWLGFWERDQIVPGQEIQEEWRRLSSFLGLPATAAQSSPA